MKSNSSFSANFEKQHCEQPGFFCAFRLKNVSQKSHSESRFGEYPAPCFVLTIRPDLDQVSQDVPGSATGQRQQIEVTPNAAVVDTLSKKVILSDGHHHGNRFYKGDATLTSTGQCVSVLKLTSWFVLLDWSKETNGGHPDNISRHSKKF